MGTIADFTFGVWIAEEEVTSGWKAANTPQTCIYTNLVEGDTYIYLDTIIKFDVKMYSAKEGDEFYGGWRVAQTSEAGQLTATAYGLVRIFIVISALVTEDISEKLKTLFKKHVVLEDGNKYLIHQRSASTFEQFPDVNGTLKKYVEIIIRSVDFTETNDGGKDKKICIITCENIDQRY